MENKNKQVWKVNGGLITYYLHFIFPKGGREGGLEYRFSNTTEPNSVMVMSKGMASLLIPGKLDSGSASSLVLET